jgi:FkbM family methyltransferase
MGQWNNVIRSRLGIKAKLVRRTLLGCELTIGDGVLRKKADYDDAWVHACASHARTIFDIGANVGFDALLMFSSTTRVDQIVLVEPNPEALCLAAEHLIRNHLSASARFVAAFASDIADEKQMFWTLGTGAAGSGYRSHAKTAARAESAFVVPTVTVDRLCDIYAIVPEFIKVDVEGAEYKVLVGSSKCLSERKTRLLVEVHSNPELPMRDNAGRIIEWCRSHGLGAWYLKEHRILEDPDHVVTRGRFHMLIQPKEWPYPDWIRRIAQGDAIETID